MPIIVSIHGRVLPEALGLTIGNIPKLHWKDAEFPEMDLDITIDGGKFSTTCTFETYSEDDHAYSLIVRIETLIRILSDLAAFSLGRRFTVILDDYTGSDEIKKQIDLTDRTVSEACTSFSLKDKTFQTVFELMVSDPYQTFALRDMASTIGHPIQSPVSFARAVETLRHTMAPNEERKKQWEVMQSNLNVSEAYTRVIMDGAQASRHGDHKAEKRGSLEALGERAWTIMNRYVEFKKAGDKPLPIDRFPLL